LSSIIRTEIGGGEGKRGGGEDGRELSSEARAANKMNFYSFFTEI
jgi:hypothetical protein